MLTVSCEHLVVAYSRADVLVNGKELILHRFPCTQCDAAVLIWDDDVNYDEIK